MNRKTVYEYAARNVIPCRRLGRRLFHRGAVVACLARSSTVGPNAQPRAIRDNRDNPARSRPKLPPETLDSVRFGCTVIYAMQSADDWKGHKPCQLNATVGAGATAPPPTIPMGRRSESPDPPRLTRTPETRLLRCKPNTWRVFARFDRAGRMPPNPHRSRRPPSHPSHRRFPPSESGSRATWNSSGSTTSRPRCETRCGISISTSCRALGICGWTRWRTP